MGTRIKKVSEGDIQREICRYLRQKGALFMRINNTPVYDPKLRQYRAMGEYALKGVPDIIVVDAYGLFIGIEVKSSKGKLSPDQLLFKKRLEKKGGIYIVARSVKDVEDVGITY